VGFAAGRFGFATLTRGRDAFPDVRGGGVTCMIGCAARAGVAARSACVGVTRQMRAPSIPIQMKPVEGAGVVPALFILFELSLRCYEQTQGGHSFLGLYLVLAAAKEATL